MSEVRAVSPPRLLVRTLMIVVTIAAIDFAAMRVVFSRAMTFGMGLQALINTIPMGLVLKASRPTWQLVAKRWGQLTETGPDGELRIRRGMRPVDRL
jgi:hypothetical protein